MLIGYNTNVPYKGTVYHVQTEDGGLKSHLIITLLYLKGTILASKKTSYSHLVASPDYKEKVREIMKEQHKTMLKELIAGKHTGDTETPSGLKGEDAVPSETAEAPEKQSGAKNQIAKSLDDILLDYIRRNK